MVLNTIFNGVLETPKNGTSTKGGTEFSSVEDKVAGAAMCLRNHIRTTSDGADESFYYEMMRVSTWGNLFPLERRYYDLIRGIRNHCLGVRGFGLSIRQTRGYYSIGRYRIGDKMEVEFVMGEPLIHTSTISAEDLPASEVETLIRRASSELKVSEKGSGSNKPPTAVNISDARRIPGRMVCSIVKILEDSMRRRLSTQFTFVGLGSFALGVILTYEDKVFYCVPCPSSLGFIHKRVPVDYGCIKDRESLKIYDWTMGVDYSNLRMDKVGALGYHGSRLKAMATIKALMAAVRSMARHEIDLITFVRALRIVRRFT